MKFFAPCSSLVSALTSPSHPWRGGAARIALAATPAASFRDLAVEAAARVEAFYPQHGLGQGEHAQLIDRAAGKIIEAPFAFPP